jgi:hypothetical protein
MANNGLKYLHIDPALREKMRREWNQPVVWPLLLIVLLLAASMVPAILVFRRRERQTATLDKA